MKFLTNETLLYTISSKVKNIDSNFGLNENELHKIFFTLTSQ